MYHFEDNCQEESDQSVYSSESLADHDINQGPDSQAAELYLSEHNVEDLFVNKEPLSWESLNELYITKTKKTIPDVKSTHLVTNPLLAIRKLKIVNKRFKSLLQKG